MTGAVAMYMESVADGQKVLCAQQRPSRRTNRSSSGRRASMNWGPLPFHRTRRRLPGTYGLYQAAFRQAGAVEAYGFDHMIDAAKAVTARGLSLQREPPSDRDERRRHGGRGV